MTKDLVQLLGKDNINHAIILGLKEICDGSDEEENRHIITFEGGREGFYLDDKGYQSTQSYLDRTSFN
mgnify:CR=1 FL=1